MSSNTSKRVENLTNNNVSKNCNPKSNESVFIRKPKGHRQKGAGTIITAKQPVVTDDGIVLQAHHRLPSQIVQEYCQKEKRPNPQYQSAPSSDANKYKFRLLLPDKKNSKDDLLFCPVQDFDTEKVAKDYAALLALLHLMPTLPLERKLPEPYSTTWLKLIEERKPSTSVKLNSSKSTPEPISSIPLNKEDLIAGETSAVHSLSAQMPEKKTTESAKTASIIPPSAETKKAKPNAVCDLQSETKYISEREKERVESAKVMQERLKFSQTEAIKRANPPLTFSLSSSLINKIKSLLGNALTAADFVEVASAGKGGRKAEGQAEEVGLTFLLTYKPGGITFVIFLLA